MRNIFLINIIFFIQLFFFIFPASAFAASITIQSAKTELQSMDEEYAVDATLSINVSDNTEYYLRGVFYRENTNNYCGYTWNETSWFKGPYSSNEEWKNFLKVIITNNSWTGVLKAKIDPDDNGCNDSGIYKFKIQRFIANTGSGTFDTQNDQSVTVVIPTPSPTLTPTPTFVPTSTPTRTPTSTPTNTPAPTKAPTLTKAPTSTPVLSPTPTSKPSATPTIKILPTDILGESTQSGEIVFPTDIQSPNENILISNETKNTNNNWLQKIFIGIGGILLITCAILLFRFYVNNKQEEV